MGKPIPPMTRFLRLIKEVDGHWMWQGTGAGAVGYKRPTFRNTTSAADPKVYAHRWIYEQTVGSIPDGYEVDHLCKVGMCVNPDHLEAVPPAENRRRERLSVCKNGHTQADDVRQYDAQGRARGCKICKRDVARERYRNQVRAVGREPNKRV